MDAMTETALVTITGGVLTAGAGQLDHNPAAVYLARLSPGGRPAMRHALQMLASLASDGRADAWTFPWWLLRYQHVEALRSQLTEHKTAAGTTYAAATVNKTLAALRGVLLASKRLGLIGAEEYAETAAVPGVRGSTLPAGRAISPGELAALLNVCAADQAPAGVRDSAIIALLYSCGLRRAELCGLALVDYDAVAGELRILGKGNKERLSPVINGAADALADWLTIRGDAPGALFRPIRRGGHMQGGELTPQAVLTILAARARQAGVKTLSPHDLRRSCASDLLDAGADIATVQRLLGHANVTTTQRYDRRGQLAKVKAVGLLHVPYRRTLRPERA
jgi:site-specific recombinase XerD